MTRRLYNEDSYVKSFCANVVSCTPYKEKMYQVVLDRTAFFPEGGGQSSDTGTIQDVKVLDVRERNEEVIHFTEGPLETGSKVECEIDWESRFDKMQQHTAEHIASGIINKIFGYQNVGFHLNNEIATMDYNGVITRAEADELEILVNQAVYANVSVQVTYPTKEELQDLIYRSKIEIEGQVRIVEVLGYDRCACCAPHVNTTGEIGVVKFTDVQSHRGGVRITMKCAKRGLLDYQEKMTSVRGIGSLLSAKENEVEEAVKRLQGELQNQKSMNWDLQKRLVDYKVEALLREENLYVVAFDEALDVAHRRELVNRLIEGGAVIAGLFVGDEDGGYQYIIGSDTQDVRDIGKELNQQCHGRGGGKPMMIQGSVEAKREKIEAVFQEIIREQSVK